MNPPIVENTAEKRRRPIFDVFTREPEIELRAPQINLGTDSSLLSFRFALARA
jgi:hypothetical protein